MSGRSVGKAADSEIAELVAPLRRVPLWPRRFAVGPRAAFDEYRLDESHLREAVSAGLPCLPITDGPLFDRFDLTNLSLGLRLRTPQRAAMRFWAGILNRPVGEVRRYEISIHARCPVPGHPGPCQFRVRTFDGAERVVRSDGAQDEPLVTAEVELHNDWPELPGRLRQLVAVMSPVRFYRLPESIRWDVDMMWRNRIGDCAAISAWLVRAGRRRGLIMRPSYGLIVSPPFSTPHFWAEALVDDRWVPCDPGLIEGLERWGVNQPGSWTPDRSPGALLARLSGRCTYAASHGPFAVSATFRTRAK
ncbi:transglutaminase domain-containing protein [Micromonospora tulbaghiae]|uniref:transglutaminase domain-containing protein n=1 Tax=Micromonospora tulbaghiae TaxID=479978 RepID=UPI003408187C